MTYRALLEMVRGEGRRKLPVKTARRVVEDLFDSIAAEVASGGRVQIPLFGMFDLRTRKGRQIRHPKTGEVITLASEKRIGFKAAPSRRQR